MRPATLSAAAIGYCIALSLSNTVFADDLATDKDKASYGFGLSAGKSARELQLDLQTLIKGVVDGMLGNEPVLDEDELLHANRRYVDSLAKLAGAEALEQGNAYLEQNAKRKGVNVTESGLQYEKLKAGTGRMPTGEDTVEVHYHGTLVDGRVFGSTLNRKDSELFPVKHMIPGWQEALPQMKVGDKWRLVVPPKLAYGDRDMPGPIRANEVLIFELELLRIVDAESTKDVKEPNDGEK